MKGTKISLGRKITGLATALFTLYLLPGLTNTSYANLGLISGFPPPLYYSIYAQEGNCVLNLNCAHDYEEGLAIARKEKKPLLIDFTGYACVNCRRMEENIWSDPQVYQLMKEKFVVVSLYVDDAKLLPVEQRFTYVTKSGIQKYIKTVGDKWATFETENFSNNSQPWYAILDNEERLLTHPVGNTPSATEYRDWLQCGWDTFLKAP
jgi:thiol:disulfide interchange protein DsbD